MTARSIIDMNWPVPDGEITFVITTSAPLTAAQVTAVGTVSEEIASLAAELTTPEKEMP